MRRKSFKGSVIDILAIVVQSFVLFMVLFIAYAILSPVFSNTQMTSGISTETKSNLEGVLYGSDYIIPFIMFMFSLISVIAAMRVSMNPVLYVFVLLIIIVMAVFGHLFQSLFQSFMLNDVNINDMPAAYFRQKFPMTSFLMDNLTNVSIGLLVLIAIATYAGSKIGM